MRNEYISIYVRCVEAILDNGAWVYKKDDASVNYTAVIKDISKPCKVLQRHRIDPSLSCSKFEYVDNC